MSVGPSTRWLALDPKGNRGTDLESTENENDLFDGRMADVELGTIEREDGPLQVTVDEMSSYYYAQDEEPGDVAGQGVNDVWVVIRPDGSIMKTETGSNYRLVPGRTSTGK